MHHSPTHWPANGTVDVERESTAANACCRDFGGEGGQANVVRQQSVNANHQKPQQSGRMHVHGSTSVTFARAVVLHV